MWFWNFNFDLALKIHVSEQTYRVLSKFNTFQLELRGQIEIKVRKFKLKPKPTVSIASIINKIIYQGKKSKPKPKP